VQIKAVLDYCKVPYDTVEVNPLTKAQLNFTKELPEDHAAHKYRKVPTTIGDVYFSKGREGSRYSEGFSRCRNESHEH